MKCFLIAMASLFLIQTASAQPVEGPYVVIQSDSAIHHVHVAARNDSIADVFWQVGNEAYHAAVRVMDGVVYAGPEAFAVADSGFVRTLEDAICAENSWIVAAYSTAENYNRTFLFHGRDAIDSVSIIDQGLNWCPDQFPNCSASYSSCIAFSENQGAVFLNWMDIWQIHFQFWESGMDYTTMPLPGDNYSQFTPFGTFGMMEGRALSMSADSATVLGWSTGLMAVCLLVGYNCGEPQYITCDAHPLEVLRTPTGRLMALCDTRHDFWWDVDQRFLEVDTATNVCHELLTLDANPLAATSDPNFGFAWLSQPGNGLLLNRADTTGALVHPAGVVYWPQEGETITGSNIGMTDGGKIMTVWTTEEIANPGPSELWIEAVDWETPLDTKPSDFIPHPSSLILSAYPNPFNNSVRISYDLPKMEEVRLEVFDLLGRHLETLVNQTMTAGSYNVTWSTDGPSGIYFVQLHAGDQTRVEKLMFIR